MECNYCDKRFSSESNLRKHKKVVHEIFQPSKHSMKCPEDCGGYFKTRRELRTHLESAHDMTICEEHHEFNSRTDFIAWKEEIECSTVVSFVSRTSKMTSTSGQIKQTFFCSRSYRPRKSNLHESTRQRSLKGQGTSKTDYQCPASMDVIEESSSKIKVTYYSTHMKHECDLAHINLSQQDRIELAGKIAQGISFERILNDIRDSLYEGENLQRRHLLTKHDLHNIASSFNLQHKERRHQSDALSVKLWVLEAGNMRGIKSPVLLFKEQISSGQNNTEATAAPVPGLQDEDFMLVIMTEAQEEICRKFGNNIICVDSTHGTNSYNFHLTSLLIVDDFNKGFPVAYCFSNRIDVKSMEIFFMAVKTRVGTICATTFMSDDYPAYYSAWCTVMGHCKCELVCSWHVDRAWRQNLSKVTGGKEIQAEVYKLCRYLLEITDVEEFNLKIEEAVKLLLSDPRKAVFGAYFRIYYAAYHKRKRWAYCHRKGVGINTNMRLEAMHRTLKHVYFKGKKVKRLDFSVSVLMKLTKDLVFQRVILLSKAGNGFHFTHAINAIKKRHISGNKFVSSNIISKGNGIWHVSSQSSINEHYVVTQEQLECDKKCKLLCNLCKVCVHMYSCSCVDSVVHCNLCKHVHAVVMHTRQNEGISTVPATDCVEYQENVQGLVQSLVVPSCSEGVKQRLLNKLSVVQGYMNTQEINCEMEHKIDKALDVVLSAFSENGPSSLRKKLDEKNEPSNKKIKLQQRFFSTTKKKKKMLIKQSLRKPCVEEKMVIENQLRMESGDNGVQNEELFVHVGFDHSYI